MPFDPSAARSSTTFSTNPNYQGAWVCYINGVEVPIIGWDVQYGVWQIPSFTIHLMPDMMLQRLGAEDRIPVQIFYLDYWYDPEHPEFRLLVDGEIIGWRFSSSSGNRSMSFSCMAHIHVFQQLYFFYMTNIDDIVAAQDPVHVSQGLPATAGLLYPYSLFHQGLLVTPTQVIESSPPPERVPGAPNQTTPAVTTPNPTEEDTRASQPIQAPYELLYNVIKGVISKNVPDTRRAVPMMNFFARHIRKTRLHNRFVRLPFLEDADQLYDRHGVFPIFNAARNDAALNAMQRQIGSQVGNSGPVWNLLQQVFSMVYMEIAMIPNPAAVLTRLRPTAVVTHSVDAMAPAAGLVQETENQRRRSQITIGVALVLRLLPLVTLTREQTDAFLEQMRQEAQSTRINSAEQYVEAAIFLLQNGGTRGAAGLAEFARQARAGVPRTPPVQPGTSVFDQAAAAAAAAEASVASSRAAEQRATSALNAVQQAAGNSPPTGVSSLMEDGRIIGLLAHDTPLTEQRQPAPTQAEVEAAQAVLAARAANPPSAHVVGDAATVYRTAIRVIEANVPADQRRTLTVFLQSGLTAAPHQSVEEARAQALTAVRNAYTSGGYADAVRILDLVQRAVAMVTDIPLTDAEVDAAQRIVRENTQAAEIINRQAQQGLRDTGLIETNVGVDPTTPVRLAQYFVKPQFFFGIPPHCNVIFPSMINSWTYDEPYMSQPTRIYVNDAVMTQLLRAQGTNRELMLHALTVAFPEEASAIMHHKSGDSPGSTSNASPSMMESGKNLLIWPEEYYKGPVTAKFELPPWFQMLQQFTNATPADGGPSPTPGATPGPSTASQPSATPGTGTTPPAPTAAFGGGRASAASVAAPSPTTPNTPPLSGATAPDPNAASPRRGIVTGGSPVVRPEALESNPNRWIIDPRIEQIGETQNPPHDGSATIAQIVEVLGRSQPRSWQLPVSENLRLLKRFILSQTLVDPQGNRVAVSSFAGVRHDRAHGGGLYMPQSELAPGHPVIAFDDPSQAIQEKRLDIHYMGRACDFMIATLHDSRGHTIPNRQGDMVAHYLIQNAALFGIQYFTWSRSQWSSGPMQNPGQPRPRRRSRSKFSWYSSSPTQARMDHYDHIHFEICIAAAAGDPRQFPWYVANGGREIPYSATGVPLPQLPTRTTARTVPRVNVSNAAMPQPGTAVVPAAAPTAANAAGAAPGAVAGASTTHTANTTPTTAGPAGGGGPVAPQEATATTNDFEALFKLYAQYEYLKQRYTVRQAAAQMLFNPYLVPGFPSMLFDSMRTRFHITGYIQSITHSAQAGTPGSMTTSVQLTCCRTFPEFMSDVRADSERFGGRVMAAPAEIISEIRARIQDEAGAEALYKRLFYGDDPRPRGTSVAVRWDEIMGYAAGMNVIPVQNDGASVATIEAQQQAVVDARSLNNTPGDETQPPDVRPPSASLLESAGAAEGQRTNTNNIDPNRELSPREVYQRAFDEYDDAMRKCSRPVCTLSQFIRFWHAGKTVNDLMRPVNGQEAPVAGPRTDFAFAAIMERDVVGTVRGPAGTQVPVRGVGLRPSAVFFDRIFILRPGPGEDLPTDEAHGIRPGNHLKEPSSEERGYNAEPAITPSATTAGVSAAYPQTRADWNVVLLAYREKVRNLLRPST